MDAATIAPDDIAAGRTPVSERATEAPAEPRQPVRAVESSALFAGGRELVIRHAGSEYRLCISLELPVTDARRFDYVLHAGFVWEF